MLLILTGLLSSCGGNVTELPGAAGDLLAGIEPAQSKDVAHRRRMTDGFISVEGDFWRTDLTAVIDPKGAATWDLGSAQDIHCGALQGDNNDFYELAGSLDGTTFTPLWTAGPIGKPGMQLRLEQHIDKQARYVRLTARGGDGFYSVGELALYGQCPKDWPPRLIAREGASDEESAQWKLGLFGLASIAFLLLNRRGAADWVRLLVAAPVGLGLSAFLELKDLWPIDDDKGQTIIRAVVAAITITILLREWMAPDRYPVNKRATAAALILLSIVSVGCYYHFGMPQFRDEAKGRTTLVHPWDMRNYFPVAKYFNELRFDGVYLGSVAAHLDNHPGMNPADIGQVHLRDLNTNEITTVGQVMDQVDGVRKRFTPERWELFKKDMKYFEDVMGAGSYLGSMQDHGGNATPVWMIAAHLLWRNAPASELTLTLTGLVDPLLWIVLFFVIARTFGVRVMLITLIVWGTTDFSRFGTNLMGSTLRADWMTALGLGFCALKTRRWALGGGLLAYGGLIRAFPAFAALFLAVPALWWVADWTRQHRKLPTARAFAQAQAPALRAITGAAGTVLVLVALSSGLFGFSQSWGTWTKKIVMHAEQPNSNHVGIRNLMQFSPELMAQRVADERRIEPWSAWQDSQRQTLAKRKPFFYLAVLVSFAGALLACRRLRLDQAAVVGLMMIPVFFYPANYYCHYVFLLPLLATRAGPARPWVETEGRTWFARLSVVVLAMGIVQVPTLRAWPDLVYTYQSIILLLAYAFILVP
ncbi:MAG: discoidin domain-containing protein, partial [Pseudomonadota bacterium]